MLRLGKLFGDERYERFAATVLRLAAPQVARHPSGFGRTLAALEFHLSPVKEIVVVGPEGNELEREVLGQYLPNAVVAISDGSDGARVPLLNDRSMTDGAPTAFVCENFVCQRPVTSVEDLRSSIAISKATTK